MADTVILSYTSSPGDVYQIEFDRFVDEEIPRQTIGQTNIEFAVLGTAYGQGPSVRQPNIWTINTLASNRVTSKALKNAANYNEVQLIKELYAAWDLDRANGLAARCVITDSVLMFGGTYTADTWFSEPPVYSVIGSFGSGLINVVFGLIEV